jgi:hypothetical protein
MGTRRDGMDELIPPWPMKPKVKDSKHCIFFYKNSLSKAYSDFQLSYLNLTYVSYDIKYCSRHSIQHVQGLLANWVVKEFSAVGKLLNWTNPFIVQHLVINNDKPISSKTTLQ